MEKKNLAAALSGLSEEQHAVLMETAQKTLRRAQYKGQQYEIPEEKVDDVGRWILSYQQKHPDMSKARVMRKAAEFFHLKPNKPE